MNDFWDWFWLMIWWFLFVAYLVLLWQICGDLFRDRDLSGWWKALWIVALIVVPWLSMLVYVIARGKGMAERHAAAVATARSSGRASRARRYSASARPMSPIVSYPEARARWA